MGDSLADSVMVAVFLIIIGVYVFPALVGHQVHSEGEVKVLVLEAFYLETVLRVRAFLDLEVLIMEGAEDVELSLNKSAPLLMNRCVAQFQNSNVQL